VTDADPSPEALAQRLRAPGYGRAPSRYALLRVVLLRGIALIYLIGFLVLAFQLRPLVGEHGLLPAHDYLSRIEQALGSRWAGFWRLPTLFWLGGSDATLEFAAWLGCALSCLVLSGFANSALMFALWALYLSFVHVGQIFYRYGWESLLCEAGFLAIFLAPPLDPRPGSANSPTPVLVVVLFRWLAFRVMFGAGLIKVRGDPCWLDLTCLAYHYETQPNPGPLSYYFHQLPLGFHKAGVVFNHLVELVAPFGVFGPRRMRLLAGAAIVAFQVTLILSGNLSFLNWLTIVVALSCFDDGVFWRVFPASFRARLAEAERAHSESRARRATLVILALGIGLLSLDPVVNLLSPRQAMNASFDPFRLVNTYGAFGSVNRERHEVVLEGTNDAQPDPRTIWKAYELPCKPGDPLRRPCLVTPYHYRLDWQMWFVQFGGYESQPWLVHLVAKLLAGDPGVLSLFVRNPFPERPARFVRAAMYRYWFTRPGEAGYWHREYLGDALRPLSRDDPELIAFLRRHRWD
jgi:hypothetical protein